MKIHVGNPLVDCIELSKSCVRISLICSSSVLLERTPIPSWAGAELSGEPAFEEPSGGVRGKDLHVASSTVCGVSEVRDMRKLFRNPRSRHLEPET